MSKFSTATAGDTAKFIAHLRKYWDIEYAGCISFNNEDDDNVAEISEYIHADDEHMADSNYNELCDRLRDLDGFEPGSDLLTCLDANGKPTPALTELAAIMVELANYPLLDENDYSQRRHDDAVENGMDYYGDDVFADWRDGNLTELSDYNDGLDAVPPPTMYPGAEFWRELPENSDVLTFLTSHAICRHLDR